MRRTLNLKFLAGVILTVAVVATAGHFLHAYQVTRNAGAFLRLADQAEQQEKPYQAIKYLRLYLEYVPEDNQARARLGLWLDQQAKVPKARLNALFLLEKVLVRDPSREDVRRRVIRILMDPYFERYGDARDHLNLLLKSHPEDGELEQLLAQCEQGIGDFRSSRSWFESATRHAPGRIEGYEQLARLLRERPNEVRRGKEESADIVQQADQLMDRMIAANPESFQAYLARARYRKQYGTARDAAADVVRAQELAPDEVDVLLALAELAREEGKLAAARQYLEQGCDKHPTNARLYQALARLEFQAGRRDEAIACLRRGIKAITDAPAFLVLDLTEVLIQNGNVTEAEDLIGRLRKAELPSELLDLLQARILVQQDQWYEAVRLLERIQAQMTKLPDQADQANLLLGRCYERLGDPDRAYIAYRRATSRDPLSVPACLGMATALTTMGEAKLDEAIDLYGRILSRMPTARIYLARLLFLKNARLPADLRRWKEVEQVINEAERLEPRPPDVVVLRAELLAARDQAERGYDLLVAARDQEPQKIEYWLALAAFAGRVEKADPVLSVLDAAEKQLGDLVELRLARARHWAARRGNEAAAALAKLEEDLDKLAAEDQRRLLNALAAAHLVAGNPDEAARLWKELARRQPNELGVKVNLFDLALRAEDQASLEQLPQEMQRIEGNEGTFWRYSEARRAIWLARKSDQEKTPQLKRAGVLLSDVVARRPTWARAVLVQGEVEDFLGNADDAISRYQQAIKLGERNALAVGRLVQLLFERQRYAEAEQVAQKLADQQPGSGEMQRMLSAISLQSQEGYPRALELAQKAAANSRDFRDHLWLGQVLWSKPERQAEAEGALRRAVELANDVPDPWVTLIEYLVRSSQKEKAEAALQEAERKLAKDRFPLALARCHEVVGRRDRAREYYEAALAANPQDVLALRAMASYCMRTGQLQDAEPYLRRLIDQGTRAPHDAAWARRTLAITMTVQGDYQQSRKALAVLGGLEEIIEGSLADTVEDQRARAIVLATQGSRLQRQKAIRILENLLGNRAATAGDQFLLAQLHEMVDDWPKARERMLSLLTSREGDNPTYLTHYIRSLLRRSELDEAQLWLTKLEKLEQRAGNPTLPSLALKVQLLKAQDKLSEAIALVNDYAKGKDSQAGAIAGLLEQLGQPAVAEELFRKYVAQSKKPESAFTLAQFLGRQNRLAEAVDVCEKAWSSCPPETAANASVTLIYTGKADPKQYDRVGRLLEAAVEKKPDSSVLLEQLAAVRNLQGRYPEAETLYRQAIERDTRNTIAMNNLAWLLAFHKDKASEALDLIRRTIELAGPDAGILDTRAMVYLSLDQPQLAIKDLEEGIAESPSAAYYFHLAQAQWKTKNREAAADAWRKATTKGLSESNLHPLERPFYQQLAQELDAK